MPWLDASVWVRSDGPEAYRRGIERDVVLGRERAEAVAFWDEWMAREGPFLAADRPWERADVVLCSTPEPACPGGRPSWSAERAQTGKHLLRERREEPGLVVTRSMEDQVVEAPVDVLLDLRDHLVRVGRDDPA